MNDFSVRPDKLKEDGDVWLEWNEQLTDISAAVPMIGPDLTVLNFSVLPGAQDVAQAYATVTDMLTTGLGAGAAEFQGITNKLVKVADMYAEVEQSLVDAISARADD